MAGLAMLVFMSLLYYMVGYSSGYNGFLGFGPLDRSQLLTIVIALVVLVLLGALGPAMIVTNLRRPGKDFWLWAAAPLSMLIIGYAVGVSR